MDDKLIISDILKSLGQTSENWGLPNAYAKVWGFLYLQGEMTQDEIHKKLRMGVGSVSEALKFLQKTGLVHIIGKEGRKKIYAAQESMSEIKKIAFENKLLLEVEPMIKTLSEHVEQTNNPTLKKRIKSLLSKYTLMRRFIKTVQRFSI